MFKRILIANRGEIALRILRTCREMGIETVAVYSEADADSPHLEQADQTICVGPGPGKESYLNIESILQAAIQTESSAIHPGYGFLAENHTFAGLCQAARITFIGPDASSILLMGDKALARETMRKAGMPVIPGSDGVLEDIKKASSLAEEIGYPVILKATAGGGGKGMRLVRSPSEFQKNFEIASLESEKAFGNPGLYLEKYIEGGRHIEFQILADAFGNVIHLGERECSVQRRHQKLVEESPSPAISPEERKELGDMITGVVARLKYQNAGTIEMLRDKKNEMYFMEMNTRLQVEHPVTEMISGVDIVREQILIAANVPLSLSQKDVDLQGHAIECRINAEDPAKDFKPDPGLVSEFTFSEKEGVRLDSHVRPGYQIPIYYDSMLAKLIVKSDDRDSAIAAMQQALADLKIAGVKTTIALHRRILETKEFRSGEYDTGLLENTSILEEPDHG